MTNQPDLKKVCEELIELRASCRVRFESQGDDNRLFADCNPQYNAYNMPKSYADLIDKSTNHLTDICHGYLELQKKFDWLSKKRWALEKCIVDMSLSNTLRISNTSDKAIRAIHKELKEQFEASIAHAGGVSVYGDWDKDDYKELPPCYIPDHLRKKEGGPDA